MKRQQLTTLPTSLQEILSSGRHDPVIFITKLLGIPLHKGQVRYLMEVAANQALWPNKKYRKFLLVPANRYGKSVTVACLQLWYLFYKFGIRDGNKESWTRAEYRTANIAPQYALTEPVFKYIEQIMTSAFPINLPDGRMVTNKCQIEWFYLKDQTSNTPPRVQYFANNSYIEHRTLGSDQGGSLQGKPYGLITYDEGGRSQHLDNEVDNNIMPRLFDWTGDLHIPSTPDQNSPSILRHFEMYEDGLHNRNQTFTMEGSLEENTFFTPEQIQAQYEMYADNPLREQVLHGKFVFGGDQLYNTAEILDAQDPELDDGLRYEEGHRYVIGIDTALATDEFVVSVVDVTTKPFRLVRQMAAKGNSKSPQMHLNDFIDLYTSYKHPSEHNITVLLETWNGESARFYQDMPYDIQLVTKCYGSWQPTRINYSDNKNRPTAKNNNIKKADILLALKKLLASRELKIPKNAPVLQQQLSIYKEDDDKIPTDRVISLALAAWMALDQQIKQIQEWQTIEW